MAQHHGRAGRPGKTRREVGIQLHREERISLDLRGMAGLSRGPWASLGARVAKALLGTVRSGLEREDRGPGVAGPSLLAREPDAPCRRQQPTEIRHF